MKRIALFILFFTASLQAQGPFHAIPFAEGHAGGYREGAGVGLLLPLSNRPNALLFGQGLVGYWKHETVASLGLGLRYLTPTGVAFGINGFGDYAHTARVGKSYWQGGFGGEIIGGFYGARANVYLNNSQRSANQQSYSGADTEGGLGISTPIGQFWGWGGYFAFDARDARRMQGPRVRGEWRLRDIFGICGAEIYLAGGYEYDTTRKGEGSFLVGVSLPLGCTPARCCQACTPCARMNLPVWRERGIWTRQNSVKH